MNDAPTIGPVLHLACLVFPSHQGTQAAIKSMLEASSKTATPPHLLVYAHGAYELDAPYHVHRVPDFPKFRSLRSGPTLAKVALDARAVLETRRLLFQIKPRAVIAHHIEAALAALCAGAPTVHYVAHTSLAHELPTYFRGRSEMTRRLGSMLLGKSARRIEQWACRATRVAAVSPSLARSIGPDAHYLPVPWTPNPTAPTEAEKLARRERLRDELGIPPNAPLCLYAGNLDHYQGWEHTIAALRSLRALHPSAHLLVATQSDVAPVTRAAAQFDVADAVHTHPLDSEEVRRDVHAAADLAWIPRRTEGGLPIKMLEAFSREVPVVATERATAGLSVDKACFVVADDDPKALADGASATFSDPTAGARRVRAARDYLHANHSSAAYARALEKWLGRGLFKHPPRQTTAPGRSGPTGQAPQVPQTPPQ